MSARFASAAFFVVSMLATGAMAQSIEEVGGPAERPPASFTGQQYVDSRGCVFMRAGMAGQTNWVPRIDRDRQVICDRPPTFGPRPAPTVVEAEPAPPPAVAEAPAPRNAGQPMETVASAMVPDAAPRRVVAVAPAPAVRQAPAVQVAATGGTGRKIGCYESTPVPVRVQLTSGGTAVLCTRGDGTLEGARAPIYPAGSGLAPSVTEPGQRVVRTTTAAPAAMAVAEAPAPVAVGAPPPGYRVAWEDDRLNPQRGPRTAAGQAQQDQVWTREVPAQAVAPAGTARASTKGEAPQGTLYVQVGSFGVPGNAARARDMLRGLGLPTARAETGGMTIVLAGPFATENEAQSARAEARGAGFGDAFIR